MLCEENLAKQRMPQRQYRLVFICQSKDAYDLNSAQLYLYLQHGMDLGMLSNIGRNVLVMAPSTINNHRHAFNP